MSHILRCYASKMAGDHDCVLDEDHPGDHQCDCGFKWPSPRSPRQKRIDPSQMKLEAA